MITRLSRFILKQTSSIVKVDSDMYDVYLYGIEISISSVLNIVLIILMGIVVHDIIAAVCFLAYVIPLRQFCGGYHASTYFRCNAIFVLTFLADYLVTKVITYFGMGTELMEAILLLSLIPVIMYAPVRNPHKEMDKAKREHCRKLGIVLSVTLSVLSVVLVFVERFYGSLLIMTQTTVSVMIVLEIILQRRGIHEA